MWKSPATSQIVVSYGIPKAALSKNKVFRTVSKLVGRMPEVYTLDLFLALGGFLRYRQMLRSVAVGKLWLNSTL